ncbi:MAG: pitrilysin family protein [bacterium]|nr:pitrilysin family protein [bacterium]
MMKRITYLFVTILLITSIFQIEAKEAKRYVLPNGMVVILREIHTAPVVALQVWVRAGSASEGEYLGTGISHYVEHMLFKGTSKRGVGEIAKEIRGAGGELDGYTSFDYTVYWVTLGSRYFDLGLDVLADAVMHPSFDPEELEKEREVILKEINMLIDSPEHYLSNIFWQEVFQIHPYRHPIIGYRDLFKKITREDILRYYHRMYIPNNIIFVATGDLDENEAIIKIKEAFCNFKRKPSTPVYVPKEPRQLGERRREVEREDIKISYLMLGFHIPSISSEDLYPLDVLAIILGQGKSSRLFKVVKEEKKLVLSIEAWSYTPRDPGIFGIKATLKPENLREAEKAILCEIERLKFGYVTQSELEKARQKVISDHIFSQETIEGQARDLALNEITTGNINFSENYIERIKKVTREDIKRVANRYLYRDNLTIATLVPKMERIRETIPKTPESRIHKPEITKFILDNGMTLLVRENHTTPSVAINAVFKGGVLFERKENNGICNFMQRMLLKGTKNRSWEEIVDEVERVGGKITGYCGNNSFGISIDILKEDLLLGLSVLQDVIMNPAFPPEEIEKEREVILEEIKAQEDEIFPATLKLFKETLWKRHPYRFQSIGNKESIAKMERKALIDFHRSFCIPNNMVLAIFGDVDTQKVIQIVKQKFKDFKRGNLPKITVSVEPKQREKREIMKKRKKEQAVALLGFRGTTVKDPDRYVFEVITSILSGQSGRLFQEIRDRLGLVYYVGTFSILGLHPGAYIFYVGTTPEHLEIVKARLLEEIEKLKKEEVAKEELIRAKRNLIGKKEIELQTNASFAFECALDELYGLGCDWVMKYSERIDRVTKEDIKRVANRYFDTDAYTLAIVKPKK